MTRRTFKIYSIAIAITLALVVGWSISAGNAYIPVIAVFVALGIKYLAQKSTRDVLQDERTRHINERASALTVRVCIPLAALVAIVLISMRRYVSAEMYVAGNVMAYFSCIVMLVHVAFYSYYNRKS